MRASARLDLLQVQGFCTLQIRSASCRPQPKNVPGRGRVVWHSPPAIDGIAIHYGKKTRDNANSAFTARASPLSLESAA